MEHVLEHTVDAPPPVRVACATEPASVSIEVWNGGPPVPDHLLESFFDKFNSTKAASGGTGLGTTFARIVTEAHGGSISVSSSAEDGTRVRLVLPRVVS
ncbi:MAG: sensor histidine kinase [Bacteroidetes bacterium]|nr:sensor histidine kinase [Bacteroidota bacterium]MDA0874335.1 sensor histidine kinase [Bacteroidota bacterium]